MSKSDIINERLKYSREMIKQINHINRSSDELNEILELAFAGMLEHYGQDAINEIYMAFLKTTFVVCNEPVEKLIARKYKLSSSVVDEIKKHSEGTFYDVVGSEYVDKNHKRTYKFNRTIYVQNDGSINKAKLLRSVIHQINHVLNSLHNPVVSVQGKLAARMGLSLDKLVSRESLDLKVEEAINSLQTDEIMDGIYDFGLYYEITDSSFKRSLEELLSIPREEVVDDEVTEIVRPLYEDDFFKNLLVDRRIIGRLTGIRTEFESYAGEGSYRAFLAACEVVSSSKDEEEKEMGKTTAKQLVKKYLEVTEEDN